MTPEEIAALDASGMRERIKKFPDQVREAVAIGQTARLALRTAGVRQILLCGLGGSAIGGDLLRSYLADELRIPFSVNRHYTLPRFVGPETLVIISSYSGNTEETNAAHREAIKRKSRILCITSGGTTAALARRNKTALITIPGGSPPRAALGYSFFPLLIALGRLGLIAKKEGAIRETLGLLEAKAEMYAIPDPSCNPALQLAEHCRGKLNILYSSVDRLDAVCTRWRGQIAENAKSLSFGHVLPEMNHNELVGWNVLRDQMRDLHVLFLRDRDDHPRVRVRLDITRETVRAYTSHITEVWSEGTSPLARMFSLVYLGDWMSFYLAMLHRVDPTPVAIIDRLKEELAKV